MPTSQRLMLPPSSVLWVVTPCNVLRANFVTVKELTYTSGCTSLRIGRRLEIYYKHIYKLQASSVFGCGCQNSRRYSRLFRRKSEIPLPSTITVPCKCTNATICTWYTPPSQCL